MNLPDISDPCDCGGSVLVKSIVPGAIVEVYQFRSGKYSLVGSARAGDTSVSVDVPPLVNLNSLEATQRMGVVRSGMSVPGIISDPPACHYVSYVPNSTVRLCQFTQDSDPTGRPHAGPTTPLGLAGTDLGISVEHGGRLYLFFGDSTLEIDLIRSRVTERGSDPIAWLTTQDPDDLENAAPDLHWITHPDGFFRRLAVDGLPVLGDYEVPTGAFSYDGHLFVFVANEPREDPHRMTASHLAGCDDPFNNNFKLLDHISNIGSPYPGGRWMIHISPTVIRNAEWPELPSTVGDGLLMFGSSAYFGYYKPDLNINEVVLGGNVYLAWAPLTPGLGLSRSPIPSAYDWHFYTGPGPQWYTLREMEMEGTGRMPDTGPHEGYLGTPVLG